MAAILQTLIRSLLDPDPEVLPVLLLLLVMTLPPAPPDTEELRTRPPLSLSLLPAVLKRLAAVGELVDHLPLPPLKLIFPPGLAARLVLMIAPPPGRPTLPTLLLRLMLNPTLLLDLFNLPPLPTLPLRLTTPPGLLP